MVFEDGVALAVALWIAGVIVGVLLWRRSIWIDDFYVEHGYDSTHWWAWPHNSGKPL